MAQGKCQQEVRGPWGSRASKLLGTHVVDTSRDDIRKGMSVLGTEKQRP